MHSLLKGATIVLLASTALTSPARSQVVEGIAIAQGVMSMFPDPDVQGTEIHSAITMLNAINDHLNALGKGIEGVNSSLKTLKRAQDELPFTIEDVHLARTQMGFDPTVADYCHKLETVKGDTKEGKRLRKDAMDYLESSRHPSPCQR